MIVDYFATAKANGITRDSRPIPLDVAYDFMTTVIMLSSDSNSLNSFTDITQPSGLFGFTLS